MRLVVFGFVVSFTALLSFQALAESPHETVCLKFAKQHLEFDQMLDRVKKHKPTKDDKEFLEAKDPAKFPGLSKITSRVRGYQKALENGEWTGPVRQILASEIGVGQIGKLVSPLRVIGVRSKTSYVAISRETADSKSYVITGWNTEKLVNGQDVQLSDPVIATGTEQVGSLRCLVIQPLSVFAPRKDDLLKAKLILEEEAMGKKK